MKEIKEWIDGFTFSGILSVLAVAMSAFSLYRNYRLERVKLRFRFDDATGELLVEDENGVLTADLRVAMTVTNEGKFPISIDRFFFEYVSTQPQVFDRGSGRVKVDCTAQLLAHGVSHSEMLAVPDHPIVINSVGVRDTTGKEQAASDAELLRFRNTVAGLHERLRQEAQDHSSG